LGRKEAAIRLANRNLRIVWVLLQNDQTTAATRPMAGHLRQVTDQKRSATGASRRSSPC
jgi:hypothetical protein